MLPRKIQLQRFLSCAVIALLVTQSCYSKTNESTSKLNINSEIRVLSKKAPNLNPQVLKLALRAYTQARASGLDQKKILTVIDYKLPDTQKRLWVFNLITNKLLFNTLVAHGQGSGDLYATHFSNSSGSHATSIGVFVTKNTYFGSKGYALRLAGLEQGINDNAEKRAIVFHGAWYVNKKFAEEYGRIGRSWGCPSLSRDIAKPVIDTIKGGTLVFAYAPNWRWLHHSRFLNSYIA